MHAKNLHASSWSYLIHNIISQELSHTTIFCYFSNENGRDQQSGILNDGYVEIGFDEHKQGRNHDQSPNERNSSKQPGTELTDSNLDKIEEDNRAIQIDSIYLRTNSIVNNPFYVNVGISDWAIIWIRKLCAYLQ